MEEGSAIDRTLISAKPDKFNVVEDEEFKIS